MNRKMFLSGLSIVSALVLVGGAAFAQYVLSASASGNTFSSSTAGLVLCNDTGGVTPAPTGCGQTITSPIADLTDLVPGVPEVGYFWIENNGTGPNDNFDTLAAIFGSGSGNGFNANPGFLYNDLQVSITCNDKTIDSQSNTIGASSFGSYYTTDGLTFTPGTLASGANARCEIVAMLPNGDNDLSQMLGFSATFGADFTVPSPTPIPSP